MTAKAMAAWFGPRILRFIPALCAVVSITWLLAKFGGNALWLPREWRFVVQSLASLIGLGIFGFARDRARILSGSAHQSPIGRAGFEVTNPAHTERIWGTIQSATSNSPETEDSLLRLRSRLQNRQRGLKWILASLPFLAGYMILRGACIYPWDAREWTRNETLAEASRNGKAAVEFERQAQQTRRSIRQATTDMSPEWQGAELQRFDPAYSDRTNLQTSASNSKSDRIVPETDVESDPDLPEFIDLKHGQVYLPPRFLFTADQKQYLQLLRSNYDEDPITHMLNEEPDRLFDWLRDSLHWTLGVTTSAFLVLHLAVIFCVSAGFGYLYDPLDSIVDLLVNS